MATWALPAAAGQVLWAGREDLPGWPDWPPETGIDALAREQAADWLGREPGRVQAALWLLSSASW